MLNQSNLVVKREEISFFCSLQLDQERPRNCFFSENTITQKKFPPKIGPDVFLGWSPFESALIFEK